MSAPNPSNDEGTRLSPPPPSDIPTGTLGPSASTSRGVPVRIGRFEVRKLLGEGAFARVFLGFDSELGREVAIKVPKVEELTPEFREAFIRENRLAAIINHANICPIYEVGTDGGVPYIVMRVVSHTLAEVLRRSTAPISPRNALAITRKLALGLAAAHAQKVIHRDLKPANVLYDEASREVLIADFGLARFVDQATAASNGVPKGTPAYMAPEQARGLADQIGPHSDVYALGVILYEMLTGRVPFHGSVWEVMRDHCETPPVPPSHLRDGLDPRLNALCLKALAKNPTQRYRSAKDFATALADYLRATESDSTAVPDSKPVPRRPTARPVTSDENRESSRGSRGSHSSRGSGEEKKSGNKKKSARRREPEFKPEPESEPAQQTNLPLNWILIGGGVLVGVVLLLAALAFIGMWVGPDSDSPSAPYKNPGDGPPSEKLKGSFPPPIDVKSAK